ncbi:PapG chaperone-binding domain-containing protein [Yersinia bercovieri]|uniref:MrpH family fimbial adhesin n=1 Tax=Yersinia bercovieri TaxID=634 RepID=UPI0011A994C9|nr:PapG chaperone-binding domain-containing protein [Yersinia bercovieri]
MLYFRMPIKDGYFFMKIARLSIITALSFYAQFSLAYSYVQESSRIQHTWSLPSGDVILTPGGSAETINISLSIFGDYNSNGEDASCVAGCQNGTMYSHPGIQLDRWMMGVGITAPSTITTNNGVSFNIEGQQSRGRNYIKIASKNMAFTDGVAYHYSPWIDWFNVPMTRPYVWHNETYTAPIKITAPENTPAGTYIYRGVIASFNHQYCGTASCSMRHDDGRYWFDYQGEIRITVRDTCKFSASSLVIDYGSIHEKEIQGNKKAVSTLLTCNSSVKSGTLKLISSSGSNWSSTDGTPVKLGKNIDAVVKINGKNASQGIPVASSTPISEPIEVTSELTTQGNKVEPGVYSGSAVLSFNIN